MTWLRSNAALLLWCQAQRLALVATVRKQVQVGHMTPHRQHHLASALCFSSSYQFFWSILIWQISQDSLKNLARRLCLCGVVL